MVWDESEETGELSLEDSAGDGVAEEGVWVIGEEGTKTSVGASICMRVTNEQKLRKIEREKKKREKGREREGERRCEWG